MLNLNLLKTQAECDAFSAEIASDRDGLDRRKGNLLSQKEDYSKNSVNLESELTRVTTRLSVADTIIAALPDGPEKNKEEANKSKLNWRLKALNNRRESFGAFAILELEVRLAELDARVGVLNDILAAVATRRAELA